MPSDLPGRERPEGRREHEIRVAQNENAFRQVNEAIDAGRHGGERVGFLCECGRLGCSTVVDLAPEAYEAVRADFRRFLVVPGHEDEQVEEVTEDHGDYLVVEKQGLAGEVAAVTDPRADSPPR